MAMAFPGIVPSLGDRLSGVMLPRVAPVRRLTLLWKDSLVLGGSYCARRHSTYSTIATSFSVMGSSGMINRAIPFPLLACPWVVWQASTPGGNSSFQPVSISAVGGV